VPSLSEWFRVSWDEEVVCLDVAPPGRPTWVASVPWSTITRVCFKGEGMEASDGVYLYTTLRPESFVIPTEATGGSQLWSEIIRRGLFNAELAVKAASSEKGLFCWPPQ
jgi:hypothetical protein